MKAPTLFDGKTDRLWQARRDSNPQHPVLETGALPIRATGLYRATICGLLGFLVRSVLTAETAVLAEFKFARSRFFVFCGCVVSLFALGATKGDDISHNCASFCSKSADFIDLPSSIRNLFNN